MDLSPLALSLVIATASTALSAVIGIALASLLMSQRFWGRDLIEVLLTAPLVMPPTVLGYYILVSVGRQSVVGRAFEHLTGSPIVFSRTGAVLAATVGAFPIVVKSTRAALEQIDPRVVFAARTLGASPLRALYSIQIPLASRAIIASLMLAFARAMGDFGVTLMVAGDIPGQTRTASLAIYNAIAAQHDADARVNVLALTSVVLGLLYIVTRLTSRANIER